MSSDQNPLLETGTDIMLEILRHFSAGTKISLVIRSDEYRTVVLTNENDLSEVIEYLQAITAPEGTLH